MFKKVKKQTSILEILLVTTVEPSQRKKESKVKGEIGAYIRYIKNPSSSSDRIQKTDRESSVLQQNKISFWFLILLTLTVTIKKK